MKKLLSLATVLLLCFSLWGCSAPPEKAQIAATTLPVYEFTLRLCEGTGLTVTRLVTESVSCLHDYSLNVRQVQAAEAAQVTVLSGGGLEEFMEDILSGQVIDASVGIERIECEEDHDHEQHDHSHEEDPHFWLSPANARIMAQNICSGLCDAYPEYREEFEKNLLPLLSDLDALEQYGKQALAELTCRELITFHDGFAYFAQAFDLTVLKAVEEESGSEASAQELIELITLTREHEVPAIFTETNGSTSAARIICAETGAKAYTLDMAMSGDSYFEAMYHNIDTIKEALE